MDDIEVQEELGNLCLDESGMEEKEQGHSLMSFAEGQLQQTSIMNKVLDILVHKNRHEKVAESTETNRKSGDEESKCPHKGCPSHRLQSTQHSSRKNHHQGHRNVQRDRSRQQRSPRKPSRRPFRHRPYRCRCDRCEDERYNAYQRENSYRLNHRGRRGGKISGRRSQTYASTSKRGRNVFVFKNA